MESILAQSDESKEFIKELCFKLEVEAAGLWLMREKVVCAPHYDLADLLELDNRLDAQIDALYLAGQTGWDASLESLKRRGRAEQYFIASFLAFVSNEKGRIQMILEKAAANPESARGIISALGWLTYKQALPHIKNLLDSKSPFNNYIGLAACSFHRLDPGDHIPNAFLSSDPLHCACGLRAMGEIRRRSDICTSSQLQMSLTMGDAESRFWAAWSFALLGNGWGDYSFNSWNIAEAVDILKSFAGPKFPYCETAINLGIRLVDHNSYLDWVHKLAKADDTRRLAIIGVGARGDTVNVPWLIKLMSIPEYARFAGEAFIMITGVDIVKEKLEGKWPEGFEAGPNADPKDDNVAMDPDENLPWPEPALIAAWWEKNKGQYPGETRLLLGKPITEERLRQILKTGRQRQRAAAALELAILKPGEPLFNVCAPAWRQMPTEAKTAQSVAALPVNYGKRELVITAVNSITPVGHNAAMTAAAVRAGINASTIYDEYRDRNGNPITVAKIKGIRDNIKDTIERFKDIAEICLKDLMNEYGEKASHRPSNVHLFLGVASGARPGPKYGKECLQSLKRIITKRVRNLTVELIPRGNASLQYAISQAARLIESKPDTLCIIGCIDSLLKNSVLNWFEKSNRLKSSTYGRNQALIASEAVCFMIVEDRDLVIQAKRPILARISALGLAEEPLTHASNLSGILTGVPKACQAALEPLKDRDIQAVFGDLNGEHSRAREWGVAELRSFEKDQQPRLWTPAFRYGDIGAASGAVMAGIAAQGFERNWLPSPVLIFCSDDHGACGAVVLEKEITSPNPLQRGT